MLTKIRENLHLLLKKSVDPDESFEIIRPPQWEMGHLGMPLFSLAKRQGKSPAQLAKDAAEKLSHEKLPDGVKRLLAIGPYLNVFLDWDVIAAYLKDHGSDLSTPAPQKKWAPILIEYSSPNLAKPLGIHHLRSTVIGHVLANFYQHAGYPVIRYNYLGDMGSAFGNLCVGAQHLYGEGWKEKKYTIDELYAAYVAYQNITQQDIGQKTDAREKAAAFTKDLEMKSAYLLDFHTHVLTVTRQAFEKIYEGLGVYFDVWDGEFNYANQNEKILSALNAVKSGLRVGQSDGAQVVYFDEDVLPSLILIKSDGSSVYMSRDILSADHRYKTYHPAKLIYVVGSEQTLHLRQLARIQNHIWQSQGAKDTPEIVHVPYGLMSIEGMKMSTRKGTVVMMEAVIEEATSEMKKRMIKSAEMVDLDQKAKQLAVGAIIFSDIFQTISKNVTFRWDDILNVEGDTGPYVYYAYARLSGILRKMNLAREKISPPKKLKLLENDTAIHQAMFLIMQFQEMAAKSMETYEPSIFARYLLSVAKASNAFYHAHPIKDETDAERKEMLLWVLRVLQDTIASAAKLLNMKVLDEL